MTRHDAELGARALIVLGTLIALVLLLKGCAAVPCTSHPYDPKCAIAPAQCREPVDAGPTAR